MYVDIRCSTHCVTLCVYIYICMIHSHNIIDDIDLITLVIVTLFVMFDTLLETVRFFILSSFSLLC